METEACRQSAARGPTGSVELVVYHGLDGGSSRSRLPHPRPLLQRRRVANERYDGGKAEQNKGRNTERPSPAWEARRAAAEVVTATAAPFEAVV